MPTSTAIVVSLVVILFVAFAGVLAWADRHTAIKG